MNLDARFPQLGHELNTLFQQPITGSHRVRHGILISHPFLHPLWPEEGKYSVHANADANAWQLNSLFFLARGRLARSRSREHTHEVVVSPACCDGAHAYCRFINLFSFTLCGFLGPFDTVCRCCCCGRIGTECGRCGCLDDGFVDNSSIII